MRTRPARAAVGAGGLAIAALLGVATAGRQVGRSGYGLDRTDEGAYLLLMAHPGEDPATVFLSGHVLHPLYALLGGDVGALRLAGFTVTAVLCAALLHRVARVGGARRWEAAGAALAGAGSAAVAFAWFPFTPSYNTIALWGCLVVGFALVGLVEPEHLSGSGLLKTGLPGSGPLGSGLPASRASESGLSTSRPALGWRLPERLRGTRGWVLAGVGVALTGLGKPTSALAAALVVLVALLALTPWRRLTAALVAVGLGVVGGLAAFFVAVFVTTRATPGDLLETMLAGVHGLRLLGGHEQLVRWDPLAPEAWAVLWGQTVTGSPWTPQVLQVLLLLPLVALVALALRRPSGRTAAVTLALVAMPACYAFGTNTNLWSGMGRAAALWLAAVALAVEVRPAASKEPAGRVPIVRAPPTDEREPADQRPVPGTHPADSREATAEQPADTADPADSREALGQQAVTVYSAGLWATRAGLPLLLVLTLIGGVTSAAAPAFYRYPSPGSDTVSGVIDAAGHRLRLTPQDARDSSALVALAAQANSPTAGRDVLDTTGASPGYIWQLGGRALGSSWLLGGYPGSAPAARHALSLVPCEWIQRALVLYAPDSPRRIDALWDDLGLAPSDYRRLLTFRHQLGYEVQLLEPTGSRTARCPTS